MSAPSLQRETENKRSCEDNSNYAQDVEQFVSRESFAVQSRRNFRASPKFKKYDDYLAWIQEVKNEASAKVLDRLKTLDINCFQEDHALNFVCPKLQRDTASFFRPSQANEFGSNKLAGDKTAFKGKVKGKELVFVTTRDRHSGNVLTRACESDPCTNSNTVAWFWDYAHKDENGKMIRKPDGLWDKVMFSGEAHIKDGNAVFKGSVVVPLNRDSEMFSLLGSAMDGHNGFPRTQIDQAQSVREDQRVRLLNSLNLNELAAEQSIEQKCLGHQGDPLKLMEYLANKTGWDPNKTSLSWDQRWLDLYGKVAAENAGAYALGVWDVSLGAVYGLGKAIGTLLVEPEARAEFGRTVDAAGDAYTGLLTECLEEMGVGIQGYKTGSKEEFYGTMCAWGRILKAGGATAVEGVKECYRVTLSGASSKEDARKFGSWMATVVNMVLTTAVVTRAASAARGLGARAGMLAEKAKQTGSQSVHAAKVIKAAQLAARERAVAAVIVDGAFGGLGTGANPFKHSDAAIAKILKELGEATGEGVKPTAKQIDTIAEYLRHVAVDSASPNPRGVPPPPEGIKELLRATDVAEVAKAAGAGKAALLALEAAQLEAHPRVKSMAALPNFDKLSPDSQNVAKELIARADGADYDQQALVNTFLKVDRNPQFKNKNEVREVIRHLEPHRLKDSVTQNDNLVAIQEAFKFYGKADPKATAELLNSFDDTARQGYSHMLKEANAILEASLKKIQVFWIFSQLRRAKKFFVSF